MNIITDMYHLMGKCFFMCECVHDRMVELNYVYQQNKFYWAEEVGGVYDTDIITITTTSIMTLADYNIRRFALKSVSFYNADIN